jgi:hypothetical protein
MVETSPVPCQYILETMAEGIPSNLAGKTKMATQQKKSGSE